MSRIRSWAPAVVVILMLAIASMATAESDSGANLRQLAKDLQTGMDTLKTNLASFDTAGSAPTTGTENVEGVPLKVTRYKDKDGNTLKVYTDASDIVVQKKLISSNNGPVLAIEYNPDGSIAKETIFEPIGLKTETIVYNSDGTKTITVVDASLKEDNTLTYKVDSNGVEIPGSATITTSPGLPEGYVYCQNTGQYQEASPA